MDTKSSIKIHIDGVSLSDDEKRRCLAAVERELARSDKIVDFRIPDNKEEKKTWYQKVGGIIDDWRWNAGVKLGMMTTEEKIALITAMPIFTTAIIKMSQEIRLVAREHRLQKKDRRMARNGY